MDGSKTDGRDWDERGLRMVPDVDAGQWIVDRVHCFDHTIASLLPPHFPAYARIFHPQPWPTSGRCAGPRLRPRTAQQRTRLWNGVDRSRLGSPEPARSVGRRTVARFAASGDRPRTGRDPASLHRNAGDVLVRALGGLRAHLCTFRLSTPSHAGAGHDSLRRSPGHGRHTVRRDTTVSHRDERTSVVARRPRVVRGNRHRPDVHLPRGLRGVRRRSPARPDLEAFPVCADQRLTWDSDTVNPLPSEPYG